MFINSVLWFGRLVKVLKSGPNYSSYRFWKKVYLLLTHELRNISSDKPCIPSNTTHYQLEPELFSIKNPRQGTNGLCAQKRQYEANSKFPPNHRNRIGIQYHSSALLPGLQQSFPLDQIEPALANIRENGASRKSSKTARQN